MDRLVVESLAESSCTKLRIENFNWYRFSQRKAITGMANCTPPHWRHIKCNLPSQKITLIQSATALSSAEEALWPNDNSANSGSNLSCATRIAYGYHAVGQHHYSPKESTQVTITSRRSAIEDPIKPTEYLVETCLSFYSLSDINTQIISHLHLAYIRCTLSMSSRHGS